jgi:hypothetical protein
VWTLKEGTIEFFPPPQQMIASGAGNSRSQVMVITDKDVLINHFHGRVQQRSASRWS